MDDAPTRIRELAQLAHRAATSDISHDLDSFLDALTHVSHEELEALFQEAARWNPGDRRELEALREKVAELAVDVVEVESALIESMDLADAIHMAALHPDPERDRRLLPLLMAASDDDPDVIARVMRERPDDGWAILALVDRLAGSVTAEARSVA